LREWRNENRDAFFDNRTISEESQRKWFSKNLDDHIDFMFMVTVNYVPMGCFGVKFIDNEWSIYNVIRGEKGHRGCMGYALSSLIREMALPVTAKVLKNNNAMRWYQQNGFEIYEEQENYFSLRFRNREGRDCQRDRVHGEAMVGVRQ
jgi:hypothetical protein